MSLPSLEELLNADISEYELLPVGTYSGVITNCEVRKGPKGPYLSIEVTVHDEGYRGRKVWRNASFSEKAINMPGGVANLVQSAQPEIDPGTTADELPSVIATEVVSSPVKVEVEHDQIKRNGALQFNPDGSPEMREQIKTFHAPDAEFISEIESEIAGVDNDLPF